MEIHRKYHITEEQHCLLLILHNITIIMITTKISIEITKDIRKDFMLNLLSRLMKSYRKDNYMMEIELNLACYGDQNLIIMLQTR